MANLNWKLGLILFFGITSLTHAHRPEKCALDLGTGGGSPALTEGHHKLINSIRYYDQAGDGAYPSTIHLIDENTAVRAAQGERGHGPFWEKVSVQKGEVIHQSITQKEAEELIRDQR